MRGEHEAIQGRSDDADVREDGERGRTTLYLVDEEDRDAVVRAQDRPNLLATTLDETVLEAAMRYRRAVRTEPRQFAVVAQAESTRSASTATDGCPSLPFSTATIDDADDFSTLVGHVDATLAEWGGAETAVVLDGVEIAVDRAGEETVFRFLHVLSQIVTARDAGLSVTVDPSAVDAAVFEPLFDAVADRRDE